MTHAVHTVPPFPFKDRWPRLLWAGDEEAIEVEKIHNRLKAEVSRNPERTSHLVCDAVQECYDLLKRLHAKRGFEPTLHILTESLPDQVYSIALDCGWLPETAHASQPEWREWLNSLLGNRFSRVDFSHPSEPEYSFAAFPEATGAGTHMNHDRAEVAAPSDALPKASAASRLKNPQRERLKREVIKMRDAHMGAKEMCDRLDKKGYLTPPRWEWRSWKTALVRNRRLVEPYLSDLK